MLSQPFQVYLAGQDMGPSAGFNTQSAISKKTTFGQLARQAVKSRATLLDVMSRKGEISASRAEKVRAARRLVPMHLIGA